MLWNFQIFSQSDKNEIKHLKHVKSQLELIRKLQLI